MRFHETVQRVLKYAKRSSAKTSLPSSRLRSDLDILSCETPQPRPNDLGSASSDGQSCHMRSASPRDGGNTPPHHFANAVAASRDRCSHSHPHNEQHGRCSPTSLSPHAHAAEIHTAHTQQCCDVPRVASPLAHQMVNPELSTRPRYLVGATLRLILSLAGTRKCFGGKSIPSLQLPPIIS